VKEPAGGYSEEVEMLYPAPRSARLAVPSVLVFASTLLLFPTDATAEPGQSRASTDNSDNSLPSGLVVVMQNKPDRALDLRVLNNPHTSGVALQIHWRDIEPVQGNPDLSKLDQLFTAAESSKKWVQLRRLQPTLKGAPFFIMR
jgi:hypothetical protein